MILWLSYTSFSHLRKITVRRKKLKESCKSHTCYIDINCSESSERNRSNVLRSNPERENGCGLVVQRLGHQNGRGAVFAVGGKVEANWHVGFGDHPILQVVRHPRVAQLRRRLDCLNKMRSWIMKSTTGWDKKLRRTDAKNRKQPSAEKKLKKLKKKLNGFELLKHQKEGYYSGLEGMVFNSGKCSYSLSCQEFGNTLHKSVRVMDPRPHSVFLGGRKDPVELCDVAERKNTTRWSCLTISRQAAL